jgi:HAMP domain-containing protein
MALQGLRSGVLDQEQLLRVLSAMKDGDFTMRLPADQEGTAREIAETVNTLMERLGAFKSEMIRISHEVGVEGKFGGQAVVDGLGGAWREMVDNLNVMGVILTCQVRNLAQIASEAANGDTSRRVTVDAAYEMDQLKQSLNRLVDQIDGR